MCTTYICKNLSSDDIMSLREYLITSDGQVIRYMIRRDCNATIRQRISLVQALAEVASLRVNPNYIVRKEVY